MTLYEQLRDALRAERPVVVATVISGAAQVGARLLAYPDGSTQGSLGEQLPTAKIVSEMLAMLGRGESSIRSYSTAYGAVELFIESFPPPATMFIVGAVHIAIALVTFAKTLGYRTVVVDARAAFATAERFAHADELIIAWPDEALAGRLNTSSAVVLLTHDPKLDDPAILAALDSPASYIGALGSPTTHAKRLERLRESGVSEEQLARLHAPIGLKIGARTPEEIAVSIIAEVVAARRVQRMKAEG